MPSVRIYNAGQVRAPADNSTANALESIAAGNAAADFGRAVSEFGTALDRRMYQDALFRNHQIVNEGRTQWTQWLSEAKQQWQPGKSDLVGDLETAWDEWQQPTVDAVENRRARQQLTTDLSRMRATFADSASSWQTQKRIAHRVQTTESILEDTANAVYADAGQSADALAQGLGLISELPVDGQVKADLSAKYSERIYGMEFAGRLDRAETWNQIANLERMLKSDEWQKKLSSSDYLRFANKIDSRKKQLQAQARSDFLDDFQETMRYVQAGGSQSTYTEASIKAAGLPAKAERAALEQLAHSERVGANAEFVKDASAATIAERAQTLVEPLLNLDQLDPGNFDEATKEYAAFSQAITDREAALDRDQVAYITANHDTARIAAERYQADPSPENLKQYESAMRAATDYLAPNRPVKLLGSAQVAKIRQQMMDVDKTPESARKVAENLATMQAEYGSVWPTIYGQLVAGKALSPTQVMAGRIPPDRRSVATSLIIANAIGEKEMRQQLEPDDTRELDAQVVAALTDVRIAMQDKPGGSQQVSWLQQAVTELALYRILRGASSSDAVETSLNDILLEDFHPIEGRLMMPKSEVSDPSLALRGLDSIQAHIENVDLIPMSGFDLDEGQALTAQVQHLKDMGVWVTSGDMKGAQLAYVSNTGDLMPVMYRKQAFAGEGPPQIVPYIVPWYQVEAAGAIIEREQFEADQQQDLPP